MTGGEGPSSGPGAPGVPARDPLAAVEASLARALGAGGPARDAALESALEALDEAATKAGKDHVRVDAYRAEVLRRLGRLREAGEAYARVVEGVMGNAEAVHRGLLDLLDGLCAYEALLGVLERAVAAHPGRAWQWRPIGEEARKRMALEAGAPLSPEELAMLRRDVSARLERRPCSHDDDRRPLAAEAAKALGKDPGGVLRWLEALGACCCDCAVARVAGPREPRR